MPIQPGSAPNSSERDHLDSWKEIAAYLNREVRTLQRWEKLENLPVHRHQHDTLGSVYAYKSELDAWRRQRQARPLPGSPLGSKDGRTGRYAFPRRESKSGKIRLVVLPFGNLSGDSGQEYFSDGLTEEMITQLGRLEPQSLGVIGRTTAMSYKGAGKRIDQIAAELDVDYLLEGCVRRSADRVRISAQLIRASDQTHLWSETYDRDVRDVLVLQDEVAQRIAREIHLALPTRRLIRTAARRQINPEAYEAYLKGRSLWYERTNVALTKSIGHFQHAIQKDPDYALAHAGLADAYGLLAIIPWDGLCPADAMPRAKEAALRALEIDDSLAEAHSSLAMVLHRYDWDWRSAERSYKRAIELNPYNARPHLWYGWLLMSEGRRDEALAELKEAEEVAKRIDPLGLVDIHATVANSWYMARKYDQAIEECRRANELSAGYFLSHYVLGRSYAQKRMYAKSSSVLKKAIVANPQNLLLVAALGHTFALSGDKAKALGMLNELKALRRKRYVPAIYFAAIYSGLHETDQAFAWLEKSYEERSDGMTYLKIERLFDSLHSNPRFQNLVKRVGFSGNP
jgi:TolB-like protein/tetratricopeptide (TPR) repeat protein